MADKRKAETKVETRDQGGVTIYSAKGVDLLAHKKGDGHYKCLCDCPSQGLFAGQTYTLAADETTSAEAHVPHVAGHLAAAL